MSTYCTYWPLHSCNPCCVCSNGQTSSNIYTHTKLSTSLWQSQDVSMKIDDRSHQVIAKVLQSDKLVNCWLCKRSDHIWPEETQAENQARDEPQSKQGEEEDLVPALQSHQLWASFLDISCLPGMIDDRDDRQWRLSVMFMTTHTHTHPHIYRHTYSNMRSYYVLCLDFQGAIAFSLSCGLRFTLVEVLCIKTQK